MLVGDKTALGDIVAAYWPVLASSFVVSLLATPVCRRVALARKLVDRPDDFLKPHHKPIPYLGGVAIFLGWTVGVGLSLVLFDAANGDALGSREAHAAPTIDRTLMIGILIAGTATMLLGLFDDLRMASPKVKLLGVTAVTALLVYAGLGDDTIVVVLRSTATQPESFPGWLILAYSVPITLFITLGACNATNLIDGVDGLCSGVLGIISAGFLALAIHLHTWGEWYVWDAQRVVLCLAMLGAALGFLPYNRNPAKIFMGDAGSMLLGLNAAILLLLFAKSGAIKWIMGSIMVFGLPIADMTLALARRWRNQKPLMQGDRSHFYDQLLDRGWPVRRVVRVSYALAAAFAVVGCSPVWLRTRYMMPLFMVVILLVAFAVKKFKMVRLERD